MNNEITRTDLELMKDLASVFHASGFFKDVKGLSQAMVKIMAGKELGLGAFTACKELIMIESNLEMSGNLMASRVKHAPQYDYRITSHTLTECSITFAQRIDPAPPGFDPSVKRWEAMGVSTFSMEDAKRAGLAGRGPWSKYPRAMLFNRAMSQGVKLYCPDMTGGMAVYSEGEIQAEVAPSEPERIPSLPTLPAPAAASVVVSEAEDNGETTHVPAITRSPPANPQPPAKPPSAASIGRMLDGGPDEGTGILDDEFPEGNPEDSGVGGAMADDDGEVFPPEEEMLPPLATVMGRPEDFGLDQDVPQGTDYERKTWLLEHINAASDREGWGEVMEQMGIQKLNATGNGKLIALWSKIKRLPRGD